MRRQKTARELIESVYFGNEYRDSAAVHSDLFILSLFEKTKDDKDFQVLWDSNWPHNIGADPYMASEEIVPKAYWDNILVSDRFRDVQTKYTIGLVIDKDVSKAIKSGDRRVVIPAISKASEKNDFPWDNYIEYLRERLTNDGGA